MASRSRPHVNEPCSANTSHSKGGPKTRTHFKSKLMGNGRRGTANSSMRSQSPSPETAINYFQNDSPLLQSPNPSLDSPRGEDIYGGTGTGLTAVVTPMNTNNGRCTCDKSTINS